MLSHKNIEAKAYETNYSRVVPHHSTELAQGNLTSEFGWDLVYPTWCDRMTTAEQHKL